MAKEILLGARRLRPDRLTLLTAAISVLGAALILAREATYGVGLSADFITYISTARSLLAGDGFIQIYDWAYLHWPPLYPMLLVAAGLGQFDPYAVAGPLNAAAFGLTIFFAGQYLRQRIQHRFLLVWACLAMMLAIPLIWVASHAISEATFILFATLALIEASKALNGDRRSDLIWAAVFVSLAVLTRYPGVTLIVAVLPLLLFQRGVVRLEKAKRVGLYLLISVLPVILWLLRNFLTHGALHGPRSPSPNGLFEILAKYFSDIAGWVFLYLPLTEARIAAAVLTGIALLALAIWCGYTFVRLRRKDGADEGWREWRPFHLFGGFALVYFVFFAAAQWQSEYEPLGDRYLSPMYIPLLFAAVFALDKFLLYERGRNLLGSVGRLPIVRADALGKRKRPSLLTVMLLIALSLWLAVGVALNVRDIRLANEQGMGMTGPQWTNSEALRYIREASVSGDIFTNSSATYIYAYTYDAKYHPLTAKLSTIRRDIEDAAPGAYIAWIGSQNPHYIAVLTELLGLEPVAELSDGSIYLVTHGDPGTRADAFFTSSVVPIVGEPFGVKLSDRVKRTGISDRERWQWEVGGDAEGWTALAPNRKSSYEYAPAAADVGKRLRAYVHYIDSDGNRVKAITEPSEPVLMAEIRSQ